MLSNSVVRTLPTNLDNLPTRLQMFIMGMLASFSFAPLGFFPLFLLSVGFLEATIIQFHRQRYKLIFDYGFFWGMGCYILNMYWINAVLFTEARFLWFLPLSILVIPAYLAVFTGLNATIFAWLLKRYDRNRTLQRWRQDRRNVRYYLLLVLSFSLIWLLNDFLCSSNWLFGGFPWNLAGYIWWFSDAILQVCAIFGIYGLTLLTIFMSGFTSVLWLKPHKHRIDYAFIFLPIAVILSCCLTYGYIRLRPHQNINEPSLELNVRLLQNNFSQKDRLNMNNFPALNNITLNHAFRGGPAAKFNKNTPPDLIIGGESIIFSIFNQNAPIKSQLLYRLQQYNATHWPTTSKAQASSQITQEKTGSQTKMLLGASTGFYLGNNRWQLYNSMILLNNNKISDIYHKNLLVPFGEYIPFSKWFPFLNIISGTINLQKGHQQNMINLQPGLDIVPLICYEAIFTSYPYKFLNNAKKRALQNQTSSSPSLKVIVNITNDAWFGITSGPYQHLHIARIRSIESGIPMIRVSDVGISAIINAKGEIVYQTKLGRMNIIDKKVYINNINTPYKRLLTN